LVSRRRNRCCPTRWCWCPRCHPRRRRNCWCWCRPRCHPTRSCPTRSCWWHRQHHRRPCPGRWRWCRQRRCRPPRWPAARWMPACPTRPGTFPTGAATSCSNPMHRTTSRSTGGSPTREIPPRQISTRWTPRARTGRPRPARSRASRGDLRALPPAEVRSDAQVPARLCPRRPPGRGWERAGGRRPAVPHRAGRRAAATARRSPPRSPRRTRPDGRPARGGPTALAGSCSPHGRASGESTPVRRSSESVSRAAPFLSCRSRTSSLCAGTGGTCPMVPRPSARGQGSAVRGPLPASPKPAGAATRYQPDRSMANRPSLAAESLSTAVPP